MTDRRATVIGVAAAVVLVTAAAVAYPGRHAVAPTSSVSVTRTPVAYPNPYDDVGPFMAGIYGADRGVETAPQYRIRAAIVPHHLAASVTIASGVKMLEGQPFKRILLLSPDHYHRCPTLFCTVDASYATLFGRVDAAPEILAALEASPLVTADRKLFEREHGVYAVLPFIAHYFPGVPVTPLVLSQRLPWRASREGLLALLDEAVDDDTMLVVSSDFSHYLPLPEAGEKDEATAKALFAADLDGIAALENPSQSDCPGCLWLLASLAARRGFYNPSTVLHTNSATIAGEEDVRESTSHFAMAWFENARLDAGDLAAAGDVTVARGVAGPSAADDPWWQGGGPRLVNLEGPLARTCAPDKNPLVFCDPLARWEAIKGAATLWGVENNHMLDRGAKGRAETARLLRDADETAVGPAMLDQGRFRVLALTAVMNPVRDARSADLAGTQAKVLAALADKQPGKLTVVLVHGGTEYRALATETEEKVWEKFIDAGADAVLVSHSHVPGDVVFHAGKPIFRGLGNFIFDQRDTPATSTAKMVRLRKEDGFARFETRLVRVR
ncbi:MAG TPA: AmmeMemoRadiSam system protein B [Candidatus Binatia bacterium]|jgi:poly-gamma-glutamate synthesis protein (capsule biosynthesis protein)|nr:AmmeMemoRadiSam system protein B [Candidatus Binatia bacterium]